MGSKQLLVLVSVVAAALAGLTGGGCRDTMPHSATWPAGGDSIPSHPKPPEGGYYTNWDPFAASVEVTPVTDVNPVGTQHILIATVKDKDGKPLPNRRVEWIIPEGKSVGAFVEVDESGIRASRGYKTTNKLAVTHTNNGDHVLTRGNSDPADDVVLTRGQTWAVITSAEEGTTHVIAYAPGIYDWQKHKVFVTKHWYDADYQWPADATNPVSTDHVLATKVMKYSDKSPLAGYLVTYKVVGGPDAVLVPGDKTTATVKTDADGMAKVTLRQAKPAEGVNKIAIEVVRPGNAACCEPEARLGSKVVTKTWIGPRIGISKKAPAAALLNAEFRYDIVVTNPAKVPANNVVVADELPAGIAYVSSRPEAKVEGNKLTWSLGSLAGGGQSAIAVTVKATQTGSFRNCATVTADMGLKGEDCAVTKVTAPKLALQKTGPAEVLLCELIEYVLVVTNNGDAPAENVQVTDMLPEGLTWRDNERGVKFNVGTVAAGQSQTMRYKAKAAKTGEYNNTAVAKADGGLEAKSSHKVVVRQPVLVLTKTGPQSRFIGKDFSWEITVANKGDTAAQNTTLTDTLPAGVTFVSATEGGKSAEGKVTWSLGTIAVNESKKVSVTVRADKMGNLTNNASATAVCAQASAQATTAIQGIPAILLEMIDVEDPIEIGKQETYKIFVTNQGSAMDTNIKIVAVIPEGQEYVSSDGPTKAEVKGQEVSFAPLASLDPKAKATFTVVVKALKAGDLRFKVTLTSDQITSPVEETEATRQYD